MTQQPYYPPQYPQAPQQAQQPYQPQYPQQPVQQAPQQYFPGVQAPPVAPQQPLANGTLDDYYSQPTGGGGPSISWAQKPDGYTVQGVVARDVVDGDVQQQTDPQTKQPKTYRDGRPMFVLRIPLKVQQSQEFPEGEASLYVRGQMREELQRAMSEAGAQGAPKGGDVITVTLTGRKPSRGGGNPMNVFAIQYQPAGGAGAPSPAPEPQQQAPSPVEAPQPVQQVPQQAPTQQYGQVVSTATGQPVQYQQAVPAPQSEVPQAAPQPAPQAQPQQGQPQGHPALPEGFSAEQQALLARMTGGQPGQAQG